MQTLHSIAELSTVPGPIVLAIGVFDGVHLGHRAVIQRALNDASAVGGNAVVVTFDPHPARILRPEQAPRLLTSTRHKIQLIHNLGVSHLLVIRFTPEFAATPPEEFIKSLHASCNPLKEICVGHQWSFGRGRSGNLEMIDRLGNELGFEEVGVPAVQIDNEVVSSTLIRAAVQEGNFQKAEKFLGREFTILGTVIEGEKIGHQLGFPTANLSAHNEQFPPDGVYAVEAQLNGKKLPGVVNIGFRPTVHKDSTNKVLELHLFDFDHDLYGQDIEIEFRKFLRPEKKFGNLEELKHQIELDVREARQLLNQAAI